MYFGDAVHYIPDHSNELLIVLAKTATSSPANSNPTTGCPFASKIDAAFPVGPKVWKVQHSFPESTNFNLPSLFMQVIRPISRTLLFVFEIRRPKICVGVAGLDERTEVLE